MPLDLIDTLAQEAVLVLSAIVLVFWIFYSIIIYRQIKTGVARKDWWISMIFYAGIVSLVLSNMLLAASMLSSTLLGIQVSTIVELISLLIFIYGFYLRMQSVVDPMRVGQIGEEPMRKADL